jgi:hypothetical protein
MTNSKTGYFIVEHDIEDVSICFVEQCDRTDQLFKDIADNIDEEEAIEKWNEFNEEVDNGLNVYIECWDGEGWPFNGYTILDAVPLFLY